MQSVSVGSACQTLTVAAAAISRDLHPALLTSLNSCCGRKTVILPSGRYPVAAGAWLLPIRAYTLDVPQCELNVCKVTMAHLNQCDRVCQSVLLRCQMRYSEVEYQTMVRYALVDAATDSKSKDDEVWQLL